MKPRPKATYHLGTCTQCGGEGDVLTIPANPLPLTLCPSCLASLIGTAAGIQRHRWEIEESEMRAETKHS